MHFSVLVALFVAMCACASAETFALDDKVYKNTKGRLLRGDGNVDEERGGEGTVKGAVKDIENALEHAAPLLGNKGAANVPSGELQTEFKTAAAKRDYIDEGFARLSQKDVDLLAKNGFTRESLKEDSSAQLSMFLKNMATSAKIKDGAKIAAILLLAIGVPASFVFAYLATAHYNPTSNAPPTPAGKTSAGGA